MGGWGNFEHVIAGWVFLSKMLILCKKKNNTKTKQNKKRKLNMLTCIYNQNWQKFWTRRKVGLSVEGSMADFYSVSHHYCKIFISERVTRHSA